ncbi:microtubule cross-linking factor 3-like [Engraulis encrasicolus]|uniref:microtubule cross-linking factor 3-like n=1 Tax=Engraulis encrasicolus TaxID=184585 RepID=UPI002FD3C3E8
MQTNTTPEPAASDSNAEPGTEQEALRDELERLEDENEDLKGEIEEMRAEMDEMRDTFYEEDTHQLQEMRRELERANKSCRILQYRLRKAERKRARFGQGGEVDDEVLRNLEQELKVAKDVSVRLHHELERVEEKRTKTEEENDKLREKLISLEVTKQALQGELDKGKGGQKRRGSKEAQKTDRRTTPTEDEDSDDLRCQLSFLNEEAELLRRRMVSVEKEREAAEHHLNQYRTLYGELPPSNPQQHAGGAMVLGLHPKGEAAGPPSSREAELKLRLRLVEEEADALSRKIVELEVENRGLRAELSDLRGDEDTMGGGGGGSGLGRPQGPGLSELREQLLLLEEEAELLRRTLSEAEERNERMTAELQTLRCREVGGSGVGSGAESVQEELRAARRQVNALAGKVLQLQTEKRRLMNNDPSLAASVTGSTSDLSVATTGARDSPTPSEGALDQHPPSSRQREGPVGGESDPDESHGAAWSQLAESRPLGRSRQQLIGCQQMVDIRQEAERLGGTIERLISDTSAIITDARDGATSSSSSLSVTSSSSATALAVVNGNLAVVPADGQEEAASGSGGGSGSGREQELLQRINGQMKGFRRDLQGFIQRLEVPRPHGRELEDTSVSVCTRLSMCSVSPLSVCLFSGCTTVLCNRTGDA